MTVSSREMRIEPRQPSRLEKKKNMPGVPLQAAGGSNRISTRDAMSVSTGSGAPECALWRPSSLPGSPYREPWLR